MEGTALSILIIAAIALAVFLGYKTKINTGFFCIVFAYIIGCFLMGLKPKTLIGYWPTNTMFVILAVSLFYNVAAANGTLNYTAWESLSKEEGPTTPLPFACTQSLQGEGKILPSSGHLLTKVRNHTILFVRFHTKGDSYARKIYSADPQAQLPDFGTGWAVPSGRPPDRAVGQRHADSLCHLR